MRLSAEQFARLSATFGGHDASACHERRRAPRVQLQSQVQITFIQDGRRSAAISVTVCDYSARGISFLHDEPMHGGDQFVAMLPLKHGGMVDLLCTVANCHPISSELVRIGAEFTCVLAPASPRDSGDQSDQITRIRDSVLD